METLWSCVIVIIILCFIGILIWLLWKRASPSKKFKGGGIKMTGGDLTIEDAIRILVEAPPVVSGLTAEHQAMVNEATIVFSKYRADIENGANLIPGKTSIESVTEFITLVLTTGNDNIIVPVISACMKSVFAVDYAKMLRNFEAVYKYYIERIDTDYLARLFFIFAPATPEEANNTSMKDLMTDDASAIRIAIEYDTMWAYLYNFLTSAPLPDTINEETMNFMKNRAYCLLSLAQKMFTAASMTERENALAAASGVDAMTEPEAASIAASIAALRGTPLTEPEAASIAALRATLVTASENALKAATELYQAYYAALDDNRVPILQSLEEISAFISRGNNFGDIVLQFVISTIQAYAPPDVIGAITLESPGAVDFDYISKAVDDSYLTQTIVQIQTTALMEALKAEPPNMQQIYAIASSLVDP